MVLFGLSRSFPTIVLRCPHSPCTDLGYVILLFYLLQPLSTWRAKRKYGRREKCDGRTHGRIQRSSRIFLIEYGVVRWLYDWVGHHMYDALSLLIYYFLSPLVGGTLSRPQDRWPHVFSHPFWAKYPYFLPCLVVALHCCMSCVVVAIFLKEVRRSDFEKCWRKTCHTDSDIHTQVCRDLFVYSPGGVERRRKCIAGRHAEATATTFVAHKTCPGFDRQLCNAYTPRDGIYGAFPVNMVDVGRVWRTRLEPGIDRLVFLSVGVYRRHLPICCLPVCRQAFWSTERIHYLRRLLRRGYHSVPNGELLAAPPHRMLSCRVMATDFPAALIVQHPQDGF